MLAHPFLKEVGQGILPREVFNFWIIQDYIFAREALRFLGALELKSTDYQVSVVLADSFGALTKELAMFEGYAEEQGINLDKEPAPICRAYTDSLISIALSGSFEEAFAALWCAEKAYFDSWCVAKNLATEDNPYKHFIDNWTSREFKEYVKWLEETFNRLTDKKPERDIKLIERSFLVIARYECLFWDMVYRRDTEDL